MNAVLQCILALDVIGDSIKKAAYDFEVTLTPFCNAYNKILFISEKNQLKSWILPQTLQKLVHQKFQPILQHDAHEFLIFFLTQLSEEIQKINKIKTSKDEDQQVQIRAAEDEAISEIEGDILLDDIEISIPNERMENLEEDCESSKELQTQQKWDSYKERNNSFIDHLFKGSLIELQEQRFSLNSVNGMQTQNQKYYIVMMQQQRGGAEKKKLKNHKRKLQLKRCCFGFTLIDGVHGIVVWDSLYALFVITTSLSTVFYYADQNQASQAFTDICSAALLIVRAIYGMWTCCKHFEYAIIRKYFIIRAVWDVALLIVNCIMVGLRMMPVQTFFLNGLMLFIVDGYLNLAIWSYMQHLIQKAQLIIKKESNENLAQIDFLKQLNQVEVLELAADNERCSITSIQQLNQENISARNDDNQNQQIQMNEIDLDLLFNHLQSSFLLNLLKYSCWVSSKNLQFQLLKFLYYKKSSGNKQRYNVWLKESETSKLR